MTDIVHQILRYMAGELAKLPTWDSVFAVCFVNESEEGTKEVERYAYLDEPDPEPEIVTPTDDMGTYIYIRELSNEISGEAYVKEGEASCEITGASVKTEFRAVAVSPTICFPVELATNLVQNIQKVNFGMFTRYSVEDIGIDYKSEIAGVKRLYEEETGSKPRSFDIEMASFNFELTFNYETACEDELPNLCKE